MTYLDNLQNLDYVITTPSIKEEILKEKTNAKILLNIKIMTLKEFLNNLVGTYNEEAIIYLMRTYNYSYDKAKTILNNIFYPSNDLPNLKQELDNHNLLIYNPNFTNNIHNIKIIGPVNIDDYTKKLLSRFNLTFIKEKENNYLPKVRHLKTITDEVVDVASLITEELKTIDINNIYLVNVPKEYYSVLKRIFNMFNIPLNIPENSSIYATKIVKDFLDLLKSSNDLDLAVKSLGNDEVSLKVLDIINKYSFTKVIDKPFIASLEKEFKNTKLDNKFLKRAINVLNFDEVIPSDNNYYHVLSFNESLVFNAHKDDDYLSDFTKSLLGLTTSIDYNNFQKMMITSIIHNTKNLTISYKDTSFFDSFYPSSLINDLNLEVITPNYNYLSSTIYNKYALGIKLDNYYKYNEKDNNLYNLYKTYGSNTYHTYHNEYNGIPKDQIASFLKDGLTLSYTSLNNYFNCGFKYYINNFLKLDPFEETFATLIGNLFHYTLSKMYEPDFDLDKCYNEYLQTITLNNKEKFFITKLKNDLAFVIETIRYQDTYSRLNATLTEQQIFVDKSNDISIKFMGIVDKIKYLETDGKVIMAIIDYKTGHPESTLDNICYGLNLQLPIYIYLADNYSFNNVVIAGFYLQHIMPKILIDEEDEMSIKKRHLRLLGYSNSDPNYLSMFDNNYISSSVIAGMGINKNNTFSSYAKVLNDEGIELVRKIVTKKIDEAINGITNGNFNINPKRIDGELVSCKYCKYQSICFRKEEDIIDLKYQKINEILEKEARINAEMDR